MMTEKRFLHTPWVLLIIIPMIAVASESQMLISEPAIMPISVGAIPIESQVADTIIGNSTIVNTTGITIATNASAKSTEIDPYSNMSAFDALMFIADTAILPYTLKLDDKFGAVGGKSIQTCPFDKLPIIANGTLICIPIDDSGDYDY